MCPVPKFYDSVPIFESIVTMVSLSDLNRIPEPTLINAPINLELESLILQSYISWIENDCESYFFDLDPTLHPISTLEPLLNLNQLHKSVLAPIPFNPEPNQPFYQITFNYLTKVYDNITLRGFTKIGHLTGITIKIGSCMILFILGL